MISRLAAALCVLWTLHAEQKYSVYRVEPTSAEGLSALRALQKLDHAIDIDFWKEAHHLGDHADVMISHRFRSFLERRLDEYSIPYNVSVPDVEKLIIRNEHKSASSTAGGKRLNDDPMLDSPGADNVNLVTDLKRAKYPFGDYASYAEMVKYLRAVEFYYPSITKIVRLGTTHEGRPIEGLKIGFPIHDRNKPAVFIDGNIHAREWASSHTALFLINELVANYGVDAEITRQINEANIFIVPCLNPDGYEFTRSSPSPAVRLWRKNRSPEKCSRSLWGGERCCGGVDLNRNFEFHWAETGSSTEPCSNIYAGSSSFSEPEARAVEDFFRARENRGKIGAYITLHTYGQLFIHPFSHATNTVPADIEKLRLTAMRATGRLARKYGTRYQVGTGADILSPASGGSDDWAKDQMKVKYVYLMELRPEEQLSNGFILHKRELIPTGVETMEAVKEVINAMLNDKSAVEAMRMVADQHTSTHHAHHSHRSNLIQRTVPPPPPTTKTTTLPPTTTTAAPTTTTTLTRTTTTARTTPSTTIRSTTTTAPTTTATTTVAARRVPTATHPSSLVPTRRRPWLTYKPKLRRILTTTLSPPTPAEVNLATTSLLWPTPASSSLMEAEDWWSASQRHTRRPPAAPPIYSTIFTTFPELRSSLSDPAYFRTHSRVSTLHIERDGPLKIPPPIPTPVKMKTLENAVPYDPECKDLRLSCAFWLENAPRVCEEQGMFMQAQCALTCKFCTTVQPSFDNADDFRTMRQ